MSPRIVEFTREYLPRVQQFECGSEIWSEFAADWIKSGAPVPSALQSMADHGTKVWLYFVEWDGEEFLVGFSSLGPTKWRFPPPDGPQRRVGFVPMLAVATAFQGKSFGESNRRYAHFIMDHVIAMAREESYPDLCLFVHPENSKAIHFYETYGFSFIGKTGPKKAQMYMRLK